MFYQSPNIKTRNISSITAMEPGLVKVSRKSLYDSGSDFDSDSDLSQNEQPLLPNIKFDFVDKVNVQNDLNLGLGDKHSKLNPGTETDEEAKTSKEEFFFPLFSTSNTSNDNGNENAKLIKINIKENDDAEILDSIAKNQKRPNSYYFASYSDDEKSQFLQIALTGEDIIKQSQHFNTMKYIKSKYNGKLIDLKQYNNDIERQLIISKKSKKLRPGKKKRLKHSESQKRKNERIKKDIEIKKLKKKLLKKKHRKRPAKKNKNKVDSSEKTTSRPKYRTE
ncbi:uncharacterized protein ASCRUDRAFT_11717 [Ascoidea rubescens DSM 1968]|uniref:Uncharacterized protein n=1 Tax=Ascoidea rubescens DSM 1968 TaxID=1344418 RepID=A0A1D2VS45_9ASCO|nr:hypothetical protein ASCRUDRAFT_11717 [Ascoidea rubescens DSM 1968]ODV64408.1 hypothetical protein ASCRUDRAFT_11717 [Ascoidea rubescens DSM 1968]